MQRGALHQLEGGGVDLAVVKVDLLVQLHLFPLCNLQKKRTQRRREKKINNIDLTLESQLHSHLTVLNQEAAGGPHPTTPSGNPPQPHSDR